MNRNAHHVSIDGQGFTRAYPRRALLAGLALVLSACGGGAGDRTAVPSATPPATTTGTPSASPETVAAPYQPMIDPADFSTTIDNRVARS